MIDFTVNYRQYEEERKVENNSFNEREDQKTFNLLIESGYFNLRKKRFSDALIDFQLAQKNSSK